MFEIQIGTLIPVQYAKEMIPVLNPMGFEGYEINCGRYFRDHDPKQTAAELLERLEGRKVSVLGCYDNTLADNGTKEDILRLMDVAPLFGTNTISVFAGCVPGRTVRESIPAFQRVFSELCRKAEDTGMTLAIENCPMGTDWTNGQGDNIGYCPDAWELMFDAVPNECLGLEWEPCHALMQLMDPVAQLRRWVSRVRHVHGKDGTVAWDVIREKGIAGGTPYAWNRTPGFGDTNWNDVCTVLMQHGYKGFIDIEGYHDPVHYDDGEWSAQLRALNYLKDCRGGREWMDCPAYRGYQTPKSARK